MQKISKYMMMAALALMGTMTTGCTNEDLAKEAPQAKNDNNTVTLTTTISLDGSATTRALDAQGKKTFAKDDQVAIFYQNTSGETQYVESEALTASDITNNGKTAKFTVTLESPKAKGQLRYVYPATMANSDIEPNDDINDENTFSSEAIQSGQDGTLDKLAKNFDLAIYDGNLTEKALLPATATLKNQLAIAELTIKDYAGNNINNKITKLEIQQGNGLYGYELTRPDNADGPIYVAMYPTSGSNKQNFTVTATTSDDTKYEKDFKFALAANNIYPLSVKTFKVVDVASGSLSVEYEARNGEMLTGTLGPNVQISIAAGATVTLKNVNINGDGTLIGGGAGIVCKGNATIILEGTNKVQAYSGNDNPGIYAATNGSANDYTLTIKGDGSLEAIGRGSGAGIGSGGDGCYPASGNIIIKGGNINAKGGNINANIYGGPGIGSGEHDSCGTITISGGTVTATGGGYAAGIGTGPEDSVCGSITITSDVTKVTATKGENALHSIGKSNDDSHFIGQVIIGCTLDEDGNPVGGTTDYISTSPYTYQPNK